MSPSESSVKGKRPKKFIESNDTALALASVIADAAEDKSNERAAKHHHASQVSVREDSRVRSASKEKLKQVKNLLKAEKARAKREKAKARKREATEEVSQSTTKNISPSNVSPATGSVNAKKRVAFA